MRTIKLLAFVFLIGVVSITSCTKEGETGPAGPKGENGNANVISKEYTITNWVKNGDYYQGEINCPAITQEILDKGAVVCYVKSADSSYFSIPITMIINGQVVSISSSIKKEWLIIRVAATAPLSTPEDLTFKVVIINGNQARIKVNLNDYEEVKAYYNLRE